MKELNVIIVEDEFGAANNLKLLLQEVAPEIKIMDILPSIEEVVAWMDKNNHPDLAFFDIELEDGLSFEIFKKTTIKFPVIFTTAYNDYAIAAFKVHSIDYLLKPIKEEDLLFSIQKFREFHDSNTSIETIESILRTVSQKSNTSFLVHFRDKMIPLAATDVAFFHIKGGLVHATSFKGQVYPIDHSLDELEETLNSKEFFRANRQFIINKKAIEDIEFYFNGRLSINLKIEQEDMILVSKARVPIFKNWMTK
ncbi:MAG: LytTR family DNA-binding domain-containing protein [Bacteroidota bacterium]